MQTEHTNIYKKARAAAGLTQEQAAEQLALSVESVKAYETGQRLPPASTVFSMADVYGTPGLRLEHARATDELKLIPREARPRAFPLAALSLVRYMIEWADRRRGRQLLAIAEDGVIDERERPLYERIACELEGIGAAWLALKCADGIKKERPEAASSKRSAPGRAENHCANIVSASVGNVKPHFCAGREVSLP